MTYSWLKFSASIWHWCAMRDTPCTIIGRACILSNSSLIRNTSSSDIVTSFMSTLSGYKTRTCSLDPTHSSAWLIS